MKNFHARVFKNTLTVALTVIVSSALIVGVVVAATTIGNSITTAGDITTAGGKIYQTGLGYSTFYGYQAGNSDDLTDNYNSAVGYQALYTNTSGSSNSAVGYQALYSNTTGFMNDAFGESTLYNNTTGTKNTAIGSWALLVNTIGELNSAIGTFSLFKNITGTGNVALGAYASAVNTSATSTVTIGYGAGGNGVTEFNAGEYTAVGTFSLGSLRTGAEDNTAVGYKSGWKVTTGANNILIGYQAADALTTGSTNIVIGYDVDLPAVSSANMLDIGNLIYGTGLSSTGSTVSTGNIGIGTTAPLARLHASSTAEQLRITNGTTVSTNFTSFKVLPAGDLIIDPQGTATTTFVWSNLKIEGKATATSDLVVGSETDTATTTLQIKSDSVGGNGSSCLEMKDVEGAIYALYVNAGALKLTAGACK